MASNLTTNFPKIVFLVQGAIQLSSAVNDLCWYHGVHDEQGVRLFEVSILLVFLASVTICSAIVSFKYTCDETKYTPIIVWCIWNVLVMVLVVYQLIEVLAYEQAWSTSVVVSTTSTSALGVLMFIQVGLHILCKKEISNFLPNIIIAHVRLRESGKAFSSVSSCVDEYPLVLSMDSNKTI